MAIQDCDELRIKRRFLSLWRNRHSRKRRVSITRKLRKMEKRNRTHVLRGLVLRYVFRQIRTAFAVWSKHCQENRWMDKLKQEKLQRRLRALTSVVVSMVHRLQRVAFMRLGRIVREGRHLTQLRQVATSLQLQVYDNGCFGLCIHMLGCFTSGSSLYICMSTCMFVMMMCKCKPCICILAYMYATCTHVCG